MCGQAILVWGEAEAASQVEDGDDRTVEILRKCANGVSTRFVRRSAAQPKELVLEITEQRPDGRRFGQRLVLEKQSEKVP